MKRLSSHNWTFPRQPDPKPNNFLEFTSKYLYLSSI
jgi:hypothetical protein